MVGVSDGRLTYRGSHLSAATILDKAVEFHPAPDLSGQAL